MTLTINNISNNIKVYRIDYDKQYCEVNIYK